MDTVANVCLVLYDIVSVLYPAIQCFVCRSFVDGGGIWRIGSDICDSCVKVVKVV